MRLLVVEDSKVLRENLIYGLRKTGYSVDGAEDGEDGLWQAQSGEFDLIVLDVNMPKRDGFSVLEELRREKNLTPVLMLTARDGVDDRINGLRTGADDYLIKPFDFGELTARVEALLRRASGVASNEITVGDLSLDLSAKRVKKGGAEIVLARREFALLECLALNPGALVTRTQIEAAIYDERVEPNSNVVDAAISILRRKIDTSGQPSLIETRRGEGYRLRTV